ncbi:HK97 family phage prohead protease [Gordonia malaquae]|uniref:HK97 family phage prohead protease n=1 Tax=Gordonia malaquae TaxID=410332 RepID=UPI003018FA37
MGTVKKKRNESPLLKAADGTAGVFTGYASVFGVKDSYGDVVEPGAFRDTLAEWAAKDTRIPVLYGHRSDDPDFNIGYVIAAEEDERGLKITAQLDMESPKGEQVYRMLKDRRIGEMSFAYNIWDSERKSDHLSLKSLELHEVSIVPIGANRETSITNIKGNCMKIDTKDARTAAMSKADGLATKAAAGDLDDAGKAELAALIDDVKEFDAKVAKALESKALIDAVAALGGEPESPADEGAKAGQVAGRKFLAFGGGQKSRAAAGTLAKAMLGGVGVKSLVASGSTVVGVPLEDKTPIEMQKIPTTLLDLLPVTQHSSPTFRYLRQKTRDMNAAPWTTGAKAESTFSVESVDGALTVIAHISEGLSTYDLLDNDALTVFAESQMLYGLRTALEAQVVNGSGTAPNMRGLLNTSGIQNQAFDTDPITTTRKAITALESTGFTPSVFVLSPKTWETISLQRANGSGTFDLGNVAVDRAAQRLHGVPVVVSNALATKTGVLLDSTAARVDADTQGIQVAWGTQGNDFGSNLIRVRTELRAGVSVLRPGGVVKIATEAA